MRAIIFDCFGVLYRSSVDELYSRCPTDRHNDLHDIRLQRDRGFLRYDEYIREVARLLDSSVEVVGSITEESHVRDQELIDYIRSIDRSRYKVGMLSNIGDTVIEQLFSSEELSEMFDETVLSYQVGMVKPDPAIFRLMAERLDCEPSECIMIDDIEENCVGAEAVGMNSVHHVHTSDTLAALKSMAA